MAKKTAVNITPQIDKETMKVVSGKNAREKKLVINARVDHKLGLEVAGKLAELAGEVRVDDAFVQAQGLNGAEEPVCTTRFAWGDSARNTRQVTLWHTGSFSYTGLAIEGFDIYTALGVEAPVAA